MQKKRQRSGNFSPMYLRLPSDIKARLDAQAELENVSQARLIVRILGDNLKDTIEAERVGDWLDRIS
jgi:predicted transcriptional regulator